MTVLIGIDAGGTKLAAGLIDAGSGAVIRRLQVPAAPERGGDAVLADCRALAAELSGAAAVIAVGLAAPELVTPDGKITSAAAWDWRGRDLAAEFASIGPLHVESDVRAAALAEARLGAGRGRASFLYLTIGTGVSHTLVLDGRPWPGARGNALVFGAPMVELKWGGHQIAAIAGRPRAEDVLANPDDAGVVAAAAAAIGTDLARLVNAMDPDAVVVGGGLGLEPSFRDQVTSAALPLIYAATTRELAVLPAALGRDAGIIGAALAAASSING